MEAGGRLLKALVDLDTAVRSSSVGLRSCYANFVILLRLFTSP